MPITPSSNAPRRSRGSLHLLPRPPHPQPQLLAPALRLPPPPLPPLRLQLPPLRLPIPLPLPPLQLQLQLPPLRPRPCRVPHSPRPSPRATDRPNPAIKSIVRCFRRDVPCAAIASWSKSSCTTLRSAKRHKRKPLPSTRGPHRAPGNAYDCRSGEERRCRSSSTLVASKSSRRRPSSSSGGASSTPWRSC
jgi:hypothetical protein